MGRMISERAVQGRANSNTTNCGACFEGSGSDKKVFGFPSTRRDGFPCPALEVTLTATSRMVAASAAGVRNASTTMSR